MLSQLANIDSELAERVASGLGHRAPIAPVAPGVPARTDLPPIVRDIPKLPPEGSPTFELTKPETDFQLKEAVALAQAMAQQRRASR